MGISGVRSPWSSTRSDSAALQPADGFTASHQSYEEPEPQPRSSDTEGEEQFSPLPPLEEEPRGSADAASNPAGSGVDLGRGNPEYMRQFEELIGRKVFTPNVAGASLGVTGPGDE
jgi:hypothetical protein